jgi:integrase
VFCAETGLRTNEWTATERRDLDRSRNPAVQVERRYPDGLLTPHHLRHTFATEALAVGVSIFERARLMGASARVIDKTYGHLARDSEATIRAPARGAFRT